MIKLACAEKEKEIKIIYTGLRPGEKLHECLYFEGDESATQIPNLFVLKPRLVGDTGFLSRARDLVERACDLDQTQLLLAIKQMAPEFQPQLPQAIPVLAPERARSVVTESPLHSAPLEA
jgi:FlaA1/EpsC-like NDP-sugar epimerase